MLRPVPVKPSSPRRVPGIAELIILVLFLCCTSALFAVKRLEDERDEWRERLSITLKSTAEVATQSNTRLQHALKIMREDDARDTRKVQVDTDANSQQEEGEHNSATGNTAQMFSDGFQGRTTIILFCYNREDYLRRTLASLEVRLPSANRFQAAGLRVVISQDGRHDGVGQVAREFVARVNEKLGIKSELVQHERSDFSQHAHMAAYYSLSAHYKRGLEFAFNDGSERAIILEDDLELAVDFFPYFETFANMLDHDPTLLAVSAWNDHGQFAHVSDADALYRSDFFPGLGWMLSKTMWEELRPKWPQAFWDDWLRSPQQRKGRHTIHPEVSRTITFGESGGASQGQFFAAYLKTMRLNDQDVKFGTKHIKLMERAAFDKWFMERVNHASLVRSAEEITAGSQSNEYRIAYNGWPEYRTVTTSLGMMDDVKDGVPRGAYRGIVPIWLSGRRVYVVPAIIPPLNS